MRASPQMTHGCIAGLESREAIVQHVETYVVTSVGGLDIPVLSLVTVGGLNLLSSSMVTGLASVRLKHPSHVLSPKDKP